MLRYGVHAGAVLASLIPSTLKAYGHCGVHAGTVLAAAAATKA